MNKINFQEEDNPSKKDSPMKKLLNNTSELNRLPQEGDFIEGTIIKIGKSAIFVDLGPVGTGIIYGGELKENKNALKELAPGQTISGLVINPENEDGYVEISLTEAVAEKTWSALREKQRNSESITVKVVDANRGGLIIMTSGISGFLPVSQLSADNYPRVEDGDKNKILSHLKGFINKEITVKIISLDQKENKLIVSEKALKEKEIKASLNLYKKGDIIDGEVSGLADFGAFIRFGNNLEGLAHISELAWQIIKHPGEIVKEKEKVKAQIINIDPNGQIFLSLKNLQEDPWGKIEDKIQPGQNIAGRVIKFGQFGAFVEIDSGVHGLIHISEFSKKNQEMEKILELNKSYNFEIASVSIKDHKMSLSLSR